jgi:general secretion pathway protein I
MKLLQNDTGFSLIEVIVALGILSTAALSLGALASGSIAGTKQLEERYLARTVLDNELARVFTEQTPLRIGVTQGETRQLGQNFGWIRTVESTQQARLLSIKVQVIDLQDESVLVQASTLKKVDR